MKKWITTKALKLTSKGLRNGSKFVSEVAEELGSKTGKTFLKHTNTIADALDSLIKRGDVIEDAVHNIKRFNECRCNIISSKNNCKRVYIFSVLRR